jgi:hypothetical protein
MDRVLWFETYKESLETNNNKMCVDLIENKSEITGNLGY